MFMLLSVSGRMHNWRLGYQTQCGGMWCGVRRNGVGPASLAFLLKSCWIGSTLFEIAPMFCYDIASSDKLQENRKEAYVLIWLPKSVSTAVTYLHLPSIND